MLKKFLFVYLLFICNLIYSQQKININGSVKCNNFILSDILIELKINNKPKFVLSDNKSFFKFLNIDVLPTDSLFIKVNHFGYNDFEQKLINIKELMFFEINLIKKNTEELNEVVVNSQQVITSNSKKTSYKINQKDFIINTKANEVLNTIPNVFVENESVIVDGKLKAKIFIDGIESLNNELKTIDANDIDKIEVVNNPSTIYGSEFLGAVVNIITKKKKQEFLKGSIGFTSGLLNDFYGFEPTLSYKKGKVTIKVIFDFKHYKQIVDYDLFRINSFGTFNQSNVNQSNANQNYFQSKINYKFSEKSNINFSGFSTGYKFIANVKGNTNLNNSIFSNFIKNGTSLNQQSSFSTFYKYRIKETIFFLIKSAYSIYEHEEKSLFNFDNSTQNYFDIKSKNKELTFNLNYEAGELKVFHKPSAFYSDFKIINRNFNFSNTSFYLIQNIINLSSELDLELSEKLATDITLTLDNSNIFNSTFSKNKLFILPTFNALYHFENKYDFKIGYSKRVIRPDAVDLNDEIFILNPGIANKGNSNLDPEIINYTFASINKSFKKNNLSLKIYNKSINNSIESVFNTNGNLLVQTLANAAKNNSTGVTIGFKTKLFKKISLNINSGFDYNEFEDNSFGALIKKNNGYTFIGNINLTTNIFKDKFSISCSGRQDGPNYSLLSKRITLPSLSLNINTNLLKDKLAINFLGKALLGYFATGYTDITNFNNNYNEISTRNNSTNFLLTLTYSLGKQFNDNIEENDIQNEDIRR